MIQRQSLIALGVALLLGAIAVYLANIFLTSNEQRAEQAAVGTTKVAVAAVALDYGMPLTPEKVRFVNYPTNSLPVGTYNRIEALLPAGQQRVALRPMQVNEPILASKISGQGNLTIAALLPDGKRAAAVRVNDVSGVAGFVQPNDSVDVLITRTVADRQVTDVLLQDTRVIAMDQNAKNADGTPNLARTATLEVEPLDAQKLALGQQIGSLSLVLRKAGDAQNNPVVETVSLEDLRYSLYGGARSPQPAALGATLPRSQVTIAAAPAAAPRRIVRRAAAPAKPKPVTSNVEIVRGTVGTDYKLGGNSGS
jgi:pilus assembly protein CpaB